MIDCEHVVVMNDLQSARQAVPSSWIRILAATNTRQSVHVSLSWTGAGLLTLNVPTARSHVISNSDCYFKAHSLQEVTLV